jgi:hypothetical protein
MLVIGSQDGLLLDVNEYYSLSFNKFLSLFSCENSVEVITSIPFKGLGQSADE